MFGFRVAYKQAYLDMLGLDAMDKITGFTGAVVSISFDVSGCVQAYLQPKAKQSKDADDSGRWFDVKRLDLGGRLVNVPDFSDPPGPAEKSAPRSGW